MQKRTSQGVRDLNAGGYNGRKSTSCPHHRAPDLTPTHTTSRLVAGRHEGVFRTAYFDTCSLCGDELAEKP